MNKKRLIIAGIVAGIAALLFALSGPAERAFTRSLPIAEMKSEIIDRAKSSVGVDLSIRGARYEILQGLVLTGVTARFGNDPAFFHAENLIVEISPFKAMKKNLSPQLRISGGRLLLENLPRARMFDLLAVMQKNESTDWKLDFDGVVLESKPSRYILSGRVTPDASEVEGRLEVRLAGKRVVKSDFRVLKSSLGASYKITGLPFQEAVRYFPGILSRSGGAISGKGSLSLDASSVAYDFHGQMQDFESPIIRGRHKPEVTLNGGFLWKENLGLIASFALRDPGIEMTMNEKLAAPGLAVREISGKITTLPWFNNGELTFAAKSRFRAASEIREQMEEIHLTLVNADYVPAENARLHIDRAEALLNNELKLDLTGSFVDHALKLKIAGPFRFGDAPDLFSGGPLVVEGEIAALNLDRLSRALFSIHSYLRQIGTADDAEKAEDTGPLWTQRRKSQAAANLLSYFSINGSIAARGIEGITQDSIPINISKNGGSISARGGYSRDAFRLEGDYAIGFDSDLPHQTIHLKYENDHNQVSLQYLTGDEKPPASLAIDYNSAMDGLLPADLIFKSTSTLYFHARNLDVKNLDPAPLIFSIAGVKTTSLDELECQRTTEGGRTMWTQIHASRGDVSWTGAGDFSSQEGGKASFFVNAPGGYSRRIDLGVTEAGKWYPREN